MSDVHRQSPISPGFSWYEAGLKKRPHYPPLDGDRRCDVVIVGGGFTGLSAALHLAKGGVRVILIEAHRIGDGASGRNGGQMGSGQRGGVLEIEKQYGFTRSKILWDIAEDAKRNLHQVANEGGFDFDYREGQLTPMHKQRFERFGRDEVEDIVNRYDYPHLKWLDRDEMAERLGSRHYFGGARDTGTGHFNPLKYVVGLAQYAMKSGASVHEQTKALNVAQASGRITVTTSSGVITADKCLLALNGHHASLEKKTARHVMPIQSFIGATEPLLIDSGILPAGEAVDDSRFVVRYFRKSPDNRMLFGGREAYTNSDGGDISRHIRGLMCEVYPQLAKTPITHAWGGSVAITMPRLPFVREVEPGLWSAGGYSGHGAMLANQTGRLIAGKFLGGNEWLDAMAALKIPPFPGGQSLRSPLLFLAMTWYSLLDRV